ncbi:MAG: hypothetical protein L6Q37_03330 [Bdellovibrionaceae bacterium]|nr:hypothetical protein [Pseudobdellovibrionaceae bacterium]
MKASMFFFMKESIKKEIVAFENLQKKYASVGADDSEPDYIFQLVIFYAITKDPIDRNKLIAWELYEDEPLAEEAAEMLTNQAWKVYDLIQKSASLEDFKELRKYCWRLDTQRE